MVTKLMFSPFLLTLIPVTAIVGQDISIDLVKRIEQQLSAQMYQLEEKHDAKIDALKLESKQREAELVKKLDELDRRVASLEKGNNALIRAIQRCRSKSLKNVLTKSRENGDGIDRTTSDETNKNPHSFGKQKMKERLVSLEKGNTKRRNAQIVKPKRALQSDYTIAFSTYLGHDVDAIGVGQTLKFNQILLNDGDGYNHHTGVFTAPVTGVYSFTFFIGQQGNLESAVALVVNSITMVEANVETNSAGEDAQGGNSAILKITAGDAVYIRNYYGNHIHGGTSYRFTTFSGFLLYPTDGDTVIVGK